ncbi:MAG: NADH-quinone oxidoreductase subunit J [Dehalococcoidia bacterium]|nr:NADH-quinone oxidoreductase subunit J [Dehalococcoidia bacterium]
MGSLIAYSFLAALIVGGALGVVTSRNVAHAALFLLTTLAAVAGIFILSLAEFLALVQVLIYGGAITIVLLFALMLTRLEEFSNVRDNTQWPMAIIASVALLVVLVGAIFASRPSGAALRGASFQEVGTQLFTKWAVPFEVASLVLLVALVGAFLLARGGGNPGDDGIRDGGNRS